ncbi:MAG: hypothetical protein KJ914_18600, partial [Gammaproteobacteria bacterium]|nr:hypothetical protein [Gammaproteobacteria bacterium]
DHDGDWRTCQKCMEEVETEMYVWYGTNEYNFQKLENPPEYQPTKCTRCDVVIRLGTEGFAVLPGHLYLCEKCSEKELRQR